jgi:DNA-binding NarL/FixJ family response regulator
MECVATRVSSPLFIGRRTELATLTEAVDRAAEGTASTILIGGDAGIGKSRLVAELEVYAQRTGTLVLEGGCVALGDGGGLPFAPVVEALRRLPALVADHPDGGLGTIDDLRTPATVELGRLLPELGSPTGPETATFDRPEWIQARIFEGLLALLRTLGERAPVVLVLEDLHWADGSTRDVTSFLARNARTERLVVIGTYRTDELHRRHPLRPWLSEMERVPRIQRLELTRFGREELESQVAAILDHPGATALLDAIERRTEGNPFFVEELLASGAEQHGERLPQTLRDVLLTRVTALSEETQRLLGVAAVAGRRVRADLLAAVTDTPEAVLEGPLREALASQILVTDAASGDAYRFRHALLAEVVYDDLLPSERRRLHAAYAAALEAGPVPPGAEAASHLAAIAHHATAAHEPVRALRAWVGAARAAGGAYAFAEALGAYERAIDLWDAVPADDRPDGVDPAALHHEASLAAIVSGRPDRGVEFARVAANLVDRKREPDRWAAASERLARAMWGSGAMDEALAMLEGTAAMLEETEPTPVRARVVAALAGAHMLRGEHTLAITAARLAIDLAHQVASPVAEAHALNTMSTSMALLGDTAEGLRVLRQAFTQTLALPDAHDDVGRAYANLSSVLLIGGQPEESFEVAMAGVAWARSIGAGGGYGRFIAGNAADAAVRLGRWDEAEALLDEVLAIDAIGVNRMGLIAVAGPFYVRRGRLDDAARLLAMGREAVEPLTEAQFTAPIYVGLLEWALTAGRPDEATSLAATALERLLRTEDRYYSGELLALAARAQADVAEIATARRDEAAAADAAAGATAHAALLDSLVEAAGTKSFGERLAMYARVARAEARRASGQADPGAWRSAAALASARGAGDAWLGAYTRYRLAEAVLGAHEPRRDAEEALSAALTEATRLSASPLVGWIEALGRRARLTIRPAEAAGAAGAAGAATPASGAPGPAAGPAAGDLALTTREREVLALVAEGYTNRRIAGMLFISESTAGVHVSNILGKLGVATRTEAATVATRLGLLG